MTLSRSRLETARSLLFVPGHRPDRFARAAASGAEAVIIELEDAVAQRDKDRTGRGRPVVCRRDSGAARASTASPAPARSRTPPYSGAHS